MMRREEYAPAMQGLFRHAIGATQVATIEDGDSQVLQGSGKCVCDWCQKILSFKWIFTIHLPANHKNKKSADFNPCEPINPASSQPAETRSVKTQACPAPDQPGGHVQHEQSRESLDPVFRQMIGTKLATELPANEHRNKQWPGIHPPLQR